MGFKLGVEMGFEMEMEMKIYYYALHGLLHALLDISEYIAPTYLLDFPCLSVLPGWSGLSALVSLYLPLE